MGHRFIEMISQFVTPEIAEALKQKGFDEPCLACYITKIKGEQPEFLYNFSMYNLWFKHNSDPSTKNWNDPNCKCSAPLWQQVTEWFRKNHYIIIEILPGGKPDMFMVFAKDYIYDGNKPALFTYNEAQEQAIKHALNQLK